MLEDSHPFDFQVQIINCIVIGQYRGSKWRECDADEVDSGNDDGSIAAWRHPDEAATAMETRGYVDIPICRERKALRAAEAAIPDARLPMRIDCPDCIVRRKCWACNV